MTTMVQTTANTLYATFHDTALAEKAIGALLDYGARSEDISLVSKDNNFINRHNERAETAIVDTGYNTGAVSPAYAAGERDGIDSLDTRKSNYDASDVPAGGINERDSTLIDNSRNYNENSDTHYDLEKTEHAAKSGISTTTPGDAAAGATKGAGIGLGLGIAAAAAAMFIPGVGLIMGGGALALAIAGAAGATAAGAVAGGVTGYLKDQGIPDQPALHYSEVYENGGSIVSIRVPSNNLDETTAQNILTKYQATNVNRYGDAAQTV